jgi:hypothetical protein
LHAEAVMTYLLKPRSLYTIFLHYQQRHPKIWLAPGGGL